jgi:hypothetical protein
MLVRRPAMAVFSAVYRFIECAHDSRYSLWPSVRRELWTVSRLAPLLFASIKCNWAPVVIAMHRCGIYEYGFSFCSSNYQSR